MGQYSINKSSTCCTANLLKLNLKCTFIPFATDLLGRFSAWDWRRIEGLPVGWSSEKISKLESLSLCFLSGQTPRFSSFTGTELILYWDTNKVTGHYLTTTRIPSKQLHRLIGVCMWNVRNGIRPMAFTSHDTNWAVNESLYSKSLFISSLHKLLVHFRTYQ